uniref:Vinculin n=1 Tax=Echinostoma caproni TaxID=27848 RepID=A0A183B082_9TREM
LISELFYTRSAKLRLRFLSCTLLYTDLPGAAECQANRDFLVSEMCDEIQEIIRGLQLTETDASELFDDDLAAIHVTKATLDSRLHFADEWLRNPNTAVDSAGEKALHQVISAAQRLASFSSSESERKAILDLCMELQSLGNSLNECRQRGEVSFYTTIACSNKVGTIRPVFMCTTAVLF